MSDAHDVQALERELEALEREVAGMRFPLLLVGISAFGLLLIMMLAIALVGGVASMLVGVLPILFLSLPMLLLAGAGFAAVGARVEPEKLVVSLNLQLIAWVLLLLQTLGFLGLGVLSAIAMIAFI